MRPAACAAAAKKNIAVIGSGVGGLATAGRLAKAGCRVTLFEKSDSVGGRLTSVQLPGGYRFDTGPSLLLFPDKYRNAFVSLGTTMEDQGIELLRVEPAAYRVFFGERDFQAPVDVFNDEEELAKVLEKEEPGAGNAYGRFRKLSQKLLELGVPYFIEKDFTRIEDSAVLFDVVPMMSGVNPLDLLGNHDNRLTKLFKSQKLRALFTFQDLYVGLSPYTAPAVFSLLAGTEQIDGIFYPRGGFGCVRDGLLSAIEKCGVQVRCQSAVSQIVLGDDMHVQGLRLETGEFFEADAIVCNKDLPAAYHLLPPSEYAERKSESLAGLQYSVGIIEYCWCVDTQLSGLAHHNIFLSDEYRESWKPAQSADELLERPNFYVHCPARTDPTAAPPGKDSVMILLPVANMQQTDASEYEALVDAGRLRILKAFSDAGLGDIKPLILHEKVITPPMWKEQYGVQHGSAFGLAHGLNQLSIFRPSNKDKHISGLYFVGASTRPGNGVPLCLIGAKLTAERMLNDFEKMEVPDVQ